MQVTQTSAEGLKHEFKVTVTAGQIAEKVLSRLGEVATTATLPGFRPGKVPMPLLKKRYGASVTSEVVEAAVNDGARQAIDDNKLRPALQPQINITSYKEGGDLEFTVAVETLPDVEVADLGTISIERPVATVDDSEVEDALKTIAAQQESTETIEGDHVAAKDDVAVIDFLGKLDGVPFDGGKGEGYPLRLGSGSFVPGFEDQLIGAKAGESRVVKITFPEDYSPGLAGKDVEFDVTVKELQRVVPRAIDDELAKAIGQESLATLRDAVKQEIESRHSQFSRAHAKRRLLDALADKHDFVLPPGMVDLEFNGIWNAIEQDRKAGRVDSGDEGKSEDELKAEYRKIAERRVKLGLVIAEIGKKNNITVSQQDLNKAMIDEARRYPGQEHLVIQYFQKNQQAVEGLRAPIFEDKVIDFILELAKVTDKAVSFDELRKDPDALEEGEAASSGEETAKPKRKKKSEE
ncbi:MAG TPA: trigger factor [Magnetospirillaceae bacterium]|jgi:trigger factor